MKPRAVTRRDAAGTIRRQHFVPYPLIDGIVVELLAPQHAGECLAHNELFIGRYRRRDNFGVEFVRLSYSGFKYRGESRLEHIGGLHGSPRKLKADRLASAR